MYYVLRTPLACLPTGAPSLNPAQKSRKSYHSRTYPKFSRNSNYSRTYADPWGVGVAHVHPYDTPYIRVVELSPAVCWDYAAYNKNTGGMGEHDMIALNQTASTISPFHSETPRASLFALLATSHSSLRPASAGLSDRVARSSESSRANKTHFAPSRIHTVFALVNSRIP